MITFEHGDLFDAANNGTTIAHGCNTAGVMGAGVAAGVRARWPACFADYRARCLAGTFRLGDAVLWTPGHGAVVINLATQVEPGAHADLSAIKRALEAACSVLSGLGIYDLAIPWIGCGIGGLSRVRVEPVLRAVGDDTLVRVRVLDLRPTVVT